MPFRKVLSDTISLSIIVSTLAAIIIFAMMSLDNYSQLREERQTLFAEQAEKSLISFEAQSVHLFDYGDSILKAVRHSFRREGVKTLDDLIFDIVSPRSERFEGTVTITDARGFVVYHSGAPFAPGTNLAGRDYFQVLRSAKVDELYVSPTDYGAITHEWWFRLVRPILGPNGFEGVVVISMRPQHIVDLYQTLALGPHSTAAMMTVRGHYLVAHLPTPPTSAYMKPMDDGPLWGLQDRASHGVYRSTDLLDGLPRSYHYQQLNDYGVVIEVSVAEQDIEDSLAGPRRNAQRQFLLFTFASLVFGGLLLAMRARSQILAERDLLQNRLLEQRAEKLAASEARFEGLVEQSLTGIFILERGRFTYVNPAFCRIFGYDHADELEVYPPIDLVAPEDRLAVHDILNRLWKGELDESRFSFRGIRQDGELVYVEVHGNGIEGPEGRQIMGALLDVTDTRRAEAEVRTLNTDLNQRIQQGVAQQQTILARLAMVMQTAAEGMLGIDDESRIIFLNQAACELLGLESAEAALGQQLHRLLGHRQSDGEECDHDGCCIHRTLLDGKIRRVSDEYFAGSTQQPIPVEYAVSPLTVEGETVGAVLVFHDVSDRREAQEQIAHLLAYQRAILDNTPVGIAIIDMERHILQANPAFCRIYGHNEFDILGRHASMLYRDAQQCEDIDHRAYPMIALGGTFSEEVLMRRADGSDVWVNIEGHLVDPSELELGVVWAVTDVTPRKQLDLELRRSNEELERFAYVASHDLRQPLRMISSYLSLLTRAMKGRLSDEESQFIGFAVDGAKRMDRMIVDLLDYSRIGRMSSEKGTVKLAEVMQHVKEALTGAIEDAGASLELPAELPEIQGYETELERLFLNLMGNALKFRVEGRAPLVRVKAEETPEGWVISVADNGIGIPPDQHQRLFQLFQRLVTREQYEGTGIGLASCRKIAEHHGGRIWVDSSPGEGSTFYVLLPR